MNPLPLLIIGAGPFGLALSAYARRHQIEHAVVGKPMEFWKSHMPPGMYLRSACDWHLDPSNEDTIEHYLATRNQAPADVEPLSLDFYLEYCEWFTRQQNTPVIPAYVQKLDYHPGSGPCFSALLDDGRIISAQKVVLALGFGYFSNMPDPYPQMFPRQRLAHTSDLSDFSRLAGKRVLIIGGRQSAFESAALIREAGADQVYLSYRHPTPSFEPSDWSWVNRIVDSMVNDPGWYRRLTREEKDQLGQRMWVEGRQKLEPWLAKRIENDHTHLLPGTLVERCKESSAGELEIGLNDGNTFTVDQVILATGYKVDVEKLPLLANGNVLGHLKYSDGFPELDEHLQSNLPGLYFTSMCATRDFGPFFAFTVSARAAAMLIGKNLQ